MLSPSPGALVHSPTALAPETTVLKPVSKSTLLSSDQAQQLVRLVETSGAVQRRHQFYFWVQSQVLSLLPHELMVCGAYQRRSRTVVFDTFQYVVVSSELLSSITDADGGVTQVIGDAWVAAGGAPQRVRLDDLKGRAGSALMKLRQELGYQELLVHGVSRPQRPQEVESLFIFGGPVEVEGSDQRLVCLDLMLPHLHRVWQRVSAFEEGLLKTVEPAPSAVRGSQEVQPPLAKALTLREVQILQCVRDGGSNQRVATLLGISPLTVKNHIQKILRKLGAGNRAQAVARAMSVGLLERQELTRACADAEG